MRNFHTLTQFCLLVGFAALVWFILLDNLAPFGVTVEQHISELGPKTRIQIDKQDGQSIIRQKADLVYFSSKMPFKFDTADVHVTFQNPDPDQTFSLGFQDQEDWHYDTQIVDAPFLNSLSWKRIGKNPQLYQRQQRYSSVPNFLSHLPQNALIGMYDYDADFSNESQAVVPDYAPASKDTVIDTPLRGRHVFYAYVSNEPFHMTIEKQDLNWYEDPDVMKVSVYKDGALVYENTIDDDGITDASRKVLPPQELTVANTGSGLPENGVYKIVIDANEDTVIKKITTNLHKIVLQGTIFPVANSQVYGSVVASTAATTVYTNALTLSAIAYHDTGEQTILVGKQLFHINALNTNEIIAPQEDFTKVVIPKNDVVVNGFQGYFAFAPDEFFLPTKYHIVPISKTEDLDLVDYVLTNYVPSGKEGIWQTQDQTFDLSSAFIKNGMLNWIISAPKLGENNRQIIIKDIDITFHKKPWI
jgi:hypothetical protein